MAQSRKSRCIKDLEKIKNIFSFGTEDAFIYGTRKKVTMFEIGDKVMVGPMVGRIVNWYFDEGNVWIVALDGDTIECCDDMLSPA